VNDALKVSNSPDISGWRADISVREILDQLSTIYGQPTLATMELNNVTFCGPYSAADAPEKLLFRCIENCAEIAILGQNLNMECQLINNAICLLLTTGILSREIGKEILQINKIKN
jgi:hypothetical protein